jgi:gas vesicle protein
MREDKKESVSNFKIFLLGGIVGSVLTFLLTPYSGYELRKQISRDIDGYLKKAKEKEQDLINKAKTAADEMLLNAEQLKALVEKYAGGKYTGPAEKIEKEIKSLKAAVDAAVMVYQNRDGEEVPATEEIVDDIFTEYVDESLPKHEGMKRRSRKG